MQAESIDPCDVELPDTWDACVRARPLAASADVANRAKAQQRPLVSLQVGIAINARSGYSGALILIYVAIITY
jgi:hypothetical protein